MNIREAWARHCTIHHRAGITLTRQPERQTATMHLRMALEVCSDDEASIYLPRLAAKLRLPTLYHEVSEDEMVWVAFEQTLPDVPPDQAGGIAGFLRIPVDDGWLPGPAPLPVPYAGAHWLAAYEALKDEPDDYYWLLKQPPTTAALEVSQGRATRIGKAGEWGVRLRVWKPFQTSDWYPISEPRAIDALLTQASLPLDGWYTAREALNQDKLAVMQRAGIVKAALP